MNRNIYRLLSSSWVLPAMPLVFGCFYLVLSVIEEPFRPDLAIAGALALLFGIILTLLVITSRVIVNEDTLDSRHYGLRRIVSLKDLENVYTRPSTFSKELILEDCNRKSVILHLGYWRLEKQLLATMRNHIQSVSANCSVGCAKLLRTQAKGHIFDDCRPRLVEPLLILAWIFISTVIPIFIGLLIT